MKSSAKRVYATLTIILISSIVLSVIIFIGGWAYIFRLSSDLAIVRTESQYLDREVEALDDLNIKYKKIEDSHQLVIDSLPKNKEVSSFMADMETLAKNNGLEIKESVIGINKDKSKVSNLELSQMTKKDGYYELTIKFSVEGSYSNFTNYLEAIKALRRVASISDVTIIKTTKAMAGQKDEVKADFVVTVYVKP
jgi:Tfp pilus assembly protein PilO